MTGYGLGDINFQHGFRVSSAKKHFDSFIILNTLSKEKSPYLLQHKNNPVNWHPWGDEAFQKAKEENKPVFLSVGYSTCHWCHVMARESFEDPVIADMMNAAFINIKVDREERPDIDSMYMLVCRMINGHSGWPLTVIMTPDKKPFFAATYIPKDTRFGRIGMRQLIPGIQGVWNHEPDKVTKAVEAIAGGFKKSQHFEAGDFPGPEAAEKAADELIEAFDSEYGGFGGAPKFPASHSIVFLLRQWHYTQKEQYLNAAEKTLTAMRLGGLWDHIGGGFHRYSTDEAWLLPHFEKMLCDQALLLEAYTEGWLATSNPLFKLTAEQIAEFVLAEFTDENGGFYTAANAESEGVEGKYYVWQTDEITAALPPGEAAWFLQRFNFKEQGNFAAESTGKPDKKNIPHLKSVLSAEEYRRFENIRSRLLQVRLKRTPPHTDNKILADYNALMIAALARAGTVFGNKQWVAAAEKAWHFITGTLFNNGTLNHRYIDGEAAIRAFADDFAFLISAGLNLYEATFKSRFLEEALNFNRIFMRDFTDKKEGGFYLTKEEKDQVLGLQKQIFDGAVPSANSAAMLNLLRLSRLTGNPEFEEAANKTGRFFSKELARSGSSITCAMQALQFIYHNTKEIILSEGDDTAGPYITALNSTYFPQKTVTLRPAKETDSIFRLAPYLKEMNPVNGKTAVYICSNYTCEAPETTPGALKKALAL